MSMFGSYLLLMRDHAVEEEWQKEKLVTLMESALSLLWRLPVAVWAYLRFGAVSVSALMDRDEWRVSGLGVGLTLWSGFKGMQCG